MMNLYQLRVFYYTAKLGSISRAADQLFITQPAVTKQIKSFQEYYNIKFFNKFGRSMVLTDAGKALYDSAKTLFEIESHIEEIIRDFQQLKSGNLNILTSESFGAYYLPSILSLFHRAYPDVNILANILTVDEVIDNTMKLNCDIGFVSFIRENPKIVAKEILEDIIMLVVSPDNPLARKNYIKTGDLNGKSIIMSEKGSTTRTIVDNFIKTNNLNIKTSIELSNNEAIKKAVAEGLGITFLSLNVVNDEIKNGTLKAVPIADNPLIRKFYMIYHKDKYFSQILNYFIEVTGQWTSRYKRTLHEVYSFNY